MGGGAIWNLGPDSAGGEASRNLDDDEEHRALGQQALGGPALVVAGLDDYLPGHDPQPWSPTFRKKNRRTRPRRSRAPVPLLVSCILACTRPPAIHAAQHERAGRDGSDACVRGQLYRRSA